LPWPLYYLTPAAAADYILVGSTQPAIQPDLNVAPSGAPEVLSYEADQVGVLEGEIYVVPHHPEARSAAKKLLFQIRKLIAQSGDDAPRGALCKLDGLGSEIAFRITRAATHGVLALRAAFELYRTGELRVEIDGKSIEAAAASEGNSARFAQALASQIYYFIKDISHRHYHHDGSSDNLLPIRPASLSNDETWRRETLWALARAVVEMRRRKQLAGHKNALGVLAYADAFQSHLARVKRLPDGVNFGAIGHGPTYDFAHTRLSLEATIDELAFNRTSWSQVIALFIATTLAAAALWTSIVQIRSATCAPTTAGCIGPPIPPWSQSLVTGLVAHPEWLLFAVFFPGLVYVEFTRRSLRVVPAYRSYTDEFTDWVTALGATISRIYRSFDPTGGDAFGAAVSLVVALIIGWELVNDLGVLLRLWHWPALSPAFALASMIVSFFR